MINKITEFFRRSMRAIIVWAVIIIVIAVMVNNNRSRQAHYEEGLLNEQTRTATVKQLMMNRSLVEVLSKTADPDTDADSPKNKRSKQIREAASVVAVNLVKSKDVTGQAALDNLFGLHKDADGTVKDNATAGIAEYGKQSNANLEELVGKLKNGDPDIRGSVTDGLKQIGGEVVAKSVARLIKDETAQDSVVTILGSVGKSAVQYVKPYLNDKDLTFRQKMVNLMGTLADPASIPDLINSSKDPQPEIRRVSLIALTKIVKATLITSSKPGDKSVTPADLKNVTDAEPTLIAVVSNPLDDSDVRAEAALTLGYTKSPDAIKGLITALGDYDLRVSQAAMTGVMTAGESAVSQLALAVKTGDDRTKATTAQSLAAIATPAAIAAVKTILSDPNTNPEVKQAAVEGFGQTDKNSKEIVAILINSLSDPSGIVANAASDSLINPAFEEDSIQPLIESFKKQSPVPFIASRTLNHMSGTVHDKVVNELKNALNASDLQTQKWAAVTLGQSSTSDPSVKEALTKLGDKASSPDLKWIAQEAIKQLSNNS